MGPGFVLPGSPGSNTSSVADLSKINRSAQSEPGSTRRTANPHRHLRREAVRVHPSETARCRLASLILTTHAPFQTNSGGSGSQSRVVATAGSNLIRRYAGPRGRGVGLVELDVTAAK